ncbi:hypothetical protein EVG20_g10159 [Dentipellis fragilis]|uniref:HAD-like protein n=1 Tax=Dentipellis fragilis TaxID=205917 RepID=A0A4Y9XW21_9AGAM|nr:hypothetical protein EVG20_g10159 [Dentipellis fragilis]
MASRKQISYVLFDMDGLMIDSERVYTDVTNEILAPYGTEMTWEMKAGLMGKPEREASAHLLSFFPHIPLNIDDYITQRNILQDQHWPHVQLLPGVERLVAHLHAHGIPTAIATGSRRRNLELKTGHLQHLFGLFGTRVVCGDDPWISEQGGRGKPFPDGEVREVESEAVPLEQREERARGLVFEDAIPGVQAGKRAGMNVVWVPDPNLLGMEARGVHGADLVLKSLEEFVPEEWGLPPYKSTPN